MQELPQLSPDFATFATQADPPLLQNTAFAPFTFNFQSVSGLRPVFDGDVLHLTKPTTSTPLPTDEQFEQFNAVSKDKNKKLLDYRDEFLKPKYSDFALWKIASGFQDTIDDAANKYKRLKSLFYSALDKKDVSRYSTINKEKGVYQNDSIVFDNLARTVELQTRYSNDDISNLTTRCHRLLTLAIESGATNIAVDLTRIHSLLTAALRVWDFVQIGLELWLSSLLNPQPPTPKTVFIEKCGRIAYALIQPLQLHELHQLIVGKHFYKNLLSFDNLLNLQVGKTEEELVDAPAEEKDLEAQLIAPLERQGYADFWEKWGLNVYFSNYDSEGIEWYFDVLQFTSEKVDEWKLEVNKRPQLSSAAQTELDLKITAPSWSASGQQTSEAQQRNQASRLLFPTLSNSNIRIVQLFLERRDTQSLYETSEWAKIWTTANGNWYDFTPQQFQWYAHVLAEGSFLFGLQRVLSEVSTLLCNNLQLASNKGVDPNFLLGYNTAFSDTTLGQLYSTYTKQPLSQAFSLKSAATLDLETVTKPDTVRIKIKSELAGQSDDSSSDSEYEEKLPVTRSRFEDKLGIATTTKTLAQYERSLDASNFDGDSMSSYNLFVLPLKAKYFGNTADTQVWARETQLFTTEWVNKWEDAAGMRTYFLNFAFKSAPSSVKIANSSNGAARLQEHLYDFLLHLSTHLYRAREITATLKYAVSDAAELSEIASFLKPKSSTLEGARRVALSAVQYTETRLRALEPYITAVAETYNTLLKVPQKSQKVAHLGQATALQTVVKQYEAARIELRALQLPWGQETLQGFQAVDQRVDTLTTNCIGPLVSNLKALVPYTNFVRENKAELEQYEKLGQSPITVDFPFIIEVKALTAQTVSSVKIELQSSEINAQYDTAREFVRTADNTTTAEGVLRFQAQLRSVIELFTTVPVYIRDYANDSATLSETRAHINAEAAKLRGKKLEYFENVNVLHTRIRLEVRKLLRRKLHQVANLQLAVYFLRYSELRGRNPEKLLEFVDGEIAKLYIQAENARGIDKKTAIDNLKLMATNREALDTRILIDTLEDFHSALVVIDENFADDDEWERIRNDIQQLSIDAENVVKLNTSLTLLINTIKRVMSSTTRLGKVKRDVINLFEDAEAANEGDAVGSDDESEDEITSSATGFGNNLKSFGVEYVNFKDRLKEKVDVYVAQHTANVLFDPSGEVVQLPNGYTTEVVLPQAPIVKPEVKAERFSTRIKLKNEEKFAPAFAFEGFKPEGKYDEPDYELDESKLPEFVDVEDDSDYLSEEVEFEDVSDEEIEEISSSDDEDEDAESLETRLNYLSNSVENIDDEIQSLREEPAAKLNKVVDKSSLPNNKRKQMSDSPVTRLDKLRDRESIIIKKLDLDSEDEDAKTAKTVLDAEIQAAKKAVKEYQSEMKRQKQAGARMRNMRPHLQPRYVSSGARPHKKHTMPQHKVGTMLELSAVESKISALESKHNVQNFDMALIKLYIEYLWIWRGGDLQERKHEWANAVMRKCETDDKPALVGDQAYAFVQSHADKNQIDLKLSKEPDNVSVMHFSFWFFRLYEAFHNGATPTANPKPKHRKRRSQTTEDSEYSLKEVARFLSQSIGKKWDKFEPSELLEPVKKLLSLLVDTDVSSLLKDEEVLTEAETFSKRKRPFFTKLLEQANKLVDGQPLPKIKKSNWDKMALAKPGGVEFQYGRRQRAQDIDVRNGMQNYRQNSSAPESSSLLTQMLKDHGIDTDRLSHYKSVLKNTENDLSSIISAFFEEARQAANSNEDNEDEQNNKDGDEKNEDEKDEQNSEEEDEENEDDESATESEASQVKQFSDVESEEDEETAEIRSYIAKPKKRYQTDEIDLTNSPLKKARPGAKMSRYIATTEDDRQVQQAWRSLGNKDQYPPEFRDAYVRSDNPDEIEDIMRMVKALKQKDNQPIYVNAAGRVVDHPSSAYVTGQGIMPYRETFNLDSDSEEWAPELEHEEIPEAQDEHWIRMMQSLSI